MIFVALALLLLPALALALRPGVSTSRRLLAAALVVFVPVVGIALALIVRRTSGGHVAPEPDDEAPTHALTAADVARLGEQPPVLERLLSGDPTERLAALVHLSNAGDAAAVGVLRWTVEHGPADVVLDAALTLEEIGLRHEAAASAARAAMTIDPSGDRALAAAEAAAAAVLNRIADAAIARKLADEAREHYQLALSAAPTRAPEIEERMARLDLATNRPRAALAVFQRLGDRFADLRDQAAFACREFSALSFVPSAPALAVPTGAAHLEAVYSQAT